ncbi:large terminase [Kordiimonas sediminis]|uniref:Large terminase n=1 Tax=Kordiimonas sediminis TaxID=1735581 RepID=A0A919AP84_9PROT|nr:terminase family protein [Kordiimonas sediminis]GHF18097.1 large terminase [Kordiimonas sediminis]
MNFSASFLRAQPQEKVQAFLTGLTDEEAAVLFYDWQFWARKDQIPPPGAWTHWLILAGRGFGKTRTGAEWVRSLVEEGAVRRIALVGPTYRDVRATMVEGESGLLAVSPPWNRPTFEPSKFRVTWPSGVLASLYSADQPERLRGPQHEAAWCDELCAWRYDQEAWDQLMFGLRLGPFPRTCITTTPKPTPLLKRLMSQADVHLTRGSTFDNLANLAPSFADTIIERYKGTRLGRQELDAEILEDTAGALWSRSMIEDAQHQGERPDFVRVVVGLDPPASAGPGADECGLIAVGLDARSCGYVIADSSSQGLSPLGWAEAAVNLYYEVEADRIVVEVNQGGAMVRALLEQIDPSVPIREVYAARGKRVRAEPVAALYEQGRVKHAGVFPILEDQLCSYTGLATFGAGSNARSPDRMDALVWAVSDLMLTPHKTLNIRKL